MVLKPLMSKHFKELIASAKVNEWAPVRANHVVWLQQIENGQAKWSDVDAKLEFHRAVVWYAASMLQGPSQQLQLVQPRSWSARGSSPTSWQNLVPEQVLQSTREAACNKMST